MTVDMDEEYTMKLLAYLRKAQERFFLDEGIEGAYWNVDITVYELDSGLEVPTRIVEDREFFPEKFDGE